MKTEWLAACDANAEFVKHMGVMDETIPLVPYLVAMNQAGFYTCSSQPTSTALNPCGTSVCQRAYVSGYMTPMMREYMFRVLPRDLVIWENASKSRLPVSKSIHGINYSWSGAMGHSSVIDSLIPFSGYVTTFHVVDLDWKREGYYLFEEVQKAVKAYNE
jgi:hypothetical protein